MLHFYEKTKLMSKKHKAEWTRCAIETKIIRVYWVFYFKCQRRRKNCTYVWEGDQSTKATMSSWHKCEFSPQNWDGFGIKTEVVVQLFSQTTWLWRVKPVKTATVKNTCKLLSHKTVTFNNDTKRSHPPERTPRSPHSFRNHDNGSETSTDRTSQSGQHLAQKTSFSFLGIQM